jgi:hypothetical protein
MPETYRRNNANREFESILHGEYEYEYNPEAEWSDYWAKAKSYASPLFNWLSGFSSKPVTSASSTTYVPPARPVQTSTATQPVGISLPPMLQSILKAMARKNYVVYQEPYKLNIVGVRSKSTTPNSFDDTINVFYKDDAGNWIFKSYPATTDPGSSYLNTPLNQKGTAILKPGQYVNSHKIGLHRNQYTALVQQRPVTVMRDANRDNVLDFTSGKEDTGLFGINLHRASQTGTTKTVGKYSAGCQVFSNINDFNEFLQMCEKHRGKYGNNFTYTLLIENDLSG